MYCRECGKLLNDNDKFCSGCGTPVAREEFIPAFKRDVKEENPMSRLAEFDPAPAEEPKKVVHHDEFDWNLEGYPDENKRTDEVDFQWESIMSKRDNDLEEDFLGFKTPNLDDEIKSVVVEKIELPKEEPKSEEEAKGTLPLDTEKEIAAVEEPATEEDSAEDDEDLESFLFANEKKPEQLSDTRVMLRKSGEEKVDKFYTFNRKNAEFQALLDQEFARLKKAQEERHSYVAPEVAEEPATEEAPVPEVAEEPAAEETPAPEVAEEPATEEAPAPEVAEEPATEEAPVPEVAEEPATEEAPAPEVAEEPVAEEAPAPEVAEEPATEEAPAPEVAEEELEYVGVALATAPLGYMAPEVESEPENPEVSASEEETQQEETPVEEVEEKETTDTEEKELPPSEEAKDKIEEPSEAAEEPKKTEQKLTFDDVFGDDDDDDEKPRSKGKAFLKFISIILCILIIAELATIGIQYFAPDSKAAEYINQGYSKVLSIIKGEKEVTTPVEATNNQEQATEGKDMIQQLIALNTADNTNIARIKYSSDATFEEGQDYGFDDFAKTYEFTDTPWFTDDEGNSITYGQKIIDAVIGYHDAWVDAMNGKDSSILDYVDQTSDFYQVVEALEGEEGTEYGINCLEIGEIRTSGSAFYVMAQCDVANSQEGGSELVKRVIYIEPYNKEMKIAEIKDL